MKAISRKRSSVSEGCVLSLLSIIFLLVGSGVFVLLCAMPLWNWYQAQGWESVSCTIEHSQVGTHSDSDGTTYSVDIAYQYQFDGQNYRSEQYNFFSGSSSGRASKEAIVAQFPRGAERTCFVNPAAPEESVLNREFSIAYLMGSFGLIFVAIALVMLSYLFRKKGDKSLVATAPVQPGTAWNESRPEETVTLQADHGSLVGCGFFFLFGLIWNGVVITAIWSMLHEASLPIGGLLFMVPFALIGIAVVGGVVYFFLSLFNPRPELTLTPGTIPLGGTAELSWYFHGSTARISQLVISVEGEEKATYRRGTSTTTDSVTFERLVLIDTTSPVEIREGRAQFTIPEFTAPSFEAPNNKIQWKINVHGDIRRWPDVKREFELTVVPLPQENPVPGLPAEFREQ